VRTVLAFTVAGSRFQMCRSTGQS